jgi:hypothetical protein
VDGEQWKATAMEEEWRAARAHLRCLRRDHPDWSARRLAQQVGRSTNWAKQGPLVEPAGRAVDDRGDRVYVANPVDDRDPARYRERWRVARTVARLGIRRRLLVCRERLLTVYRRFFTFAPMLIASNRPVI